MTLSKISLARSRSTRTPFTSCSFMVTTCETSSRLGPSRTIQSDSIADRARSTRSPDPAQRLLGTWELFRYLAKKQPYKSLPQHQHIHEDSVETSDLVALLAILFLFFSASLAAIEAILASMAAAWSAGISDSTRPSVFFELLWRRRCA